MSEEIKAIRTMMRSELSDWIEARIPEFLGLLGGEVPTLPVVEDFRLILCLADGADPDACDYYPVVDSGTAMHRQVGLLQQNIDYLRWRATDDD